MTGIEWKRLKTARLTAWRRPPPRHSASLARTSRDVFSTARHYTGRQHRRTCSIASVNSDSRKLSQKVRYDCRQWTLPCVRLTDRDQLCRCGEARHVTKLPRDAAPTVCADAKV